MHGAMMTKNSLTARQQHVCDLIALGHSNKQIATELGVVSRTIESHRSAIYRKLEVRNAVELVRKLLGAS